MGPARRPSATHLARFSIISPLGSPPERDSPRTIFDHFTARLAARARLTSHYHADDTSAIMVH
jgi:hypothetical protein